MEGCDDAVVSVLSEAEGFGAVWMCFDCLDGVVYYRVRVEMLQCLVSNCGCCTRAVIGRIVVPEWRIVGLE